MLRLLVRAASVGEPTPGCARQSELREPTICQGSKGSKNFTLNGRGNDVAMIDLSEHELQRYAEVVEPDESVIGRDDVVERVIAALGLREARPALIVGPPGRGRTAALSAIRGRPDTSGTG